MTPSLLAWTIPSPSEGVWHLGPFPIRGYALCIILGVVVAIWMGERRWVARGGTPGQVSDLAIWAIPFGLVGGRLYHVLTDWHLYFGEGREPITALYVWRGGLGIWGAIGLGALGVVIGARVMGIRILPMLDALAPAALVAMAIGRWGNWFNQELYGRPTDLPWGLEIDQEHRFDVPDQYADAAAFHPTFLYEFLWDLGIAGILIWADRRFKLGYGRVLALYVAGYTVGRGAIETLRIDSVQLDDVYGLRWNVWMSILLFVLAVAYFVISLRRHPGREESVFLPGRAPEDAASRDERAEESDDEAGGADDADDSDEADDAGEADATDAADDPDSGSDSAREPDETASERPSSD